MCRVRAEEAEGETQTRLGQRSTEQHSVATSTDDRTGQSRFGTRSTAQHSRVAFWYAQHSTAQSRFGTRSTAQHSTAQHTRHGEFGTTCLEPNPIPSQLSYMFCRRHELGALWITVDCCLTTVFRS